MYMIIIYYYGYMTATFRDYYLGNLRRIYGEEFGSYLVVIFYYSYY